MQWTAINVQEVDVSLLTEDQQQLVTESGLIILVTRSGNLWSNTLIPGDQWTNVITGIPILTEESLEILTENDLPLLVRHGIDMTWTKVNG